ncbi:hypothetical protein OT109_14035 [Phycisphaeraceae bacterium D3-23]
MDPNRPQDAARHLGVNKTLTWNISRLIQSDQGVSAAVHVPGPQSVERMLKAVKKHGACPEKVDRVRLAVRSFDATIETHIGDRADLELMLDSMGNGKSTGLDLSRKMSYRGNSGVFGVQAKTRTSSVFLAPNPSAPDLLDVAIVSGYTGLRRLRANTRWPIFRMQSWGADAASPTGWQPLEGDGDVEHVGLLPAFTTGASPKITRNDTTGGIDYILEPGPVGNVGAMDCFRGQKHLADLPRYATESDDAGEFGVPIITPCQNLVFDLIVHRDLDYLQEVEGVVMGKIFSQGDDQSFSDSQAVLPIQAEPMKLAGSPPAIATPLVPRYPELFGYVGECMGWDFSEFAAVRLQVLYPPLGSTVLLRFPLSAPPAR